MTTNKATKKTASECDCDDSCDCGCNCDCGGDMGFQRRFMTHKEEIEMLEDYRSDLKLELEAVEERIKDLKSKRG